MFVASEAIVWHLNSAISDLNGRRHLAKARQANPRVWYPPDQTVCMTALAAQPDRRSPALLKLGTRCHLECPTAITHQARLVNDLQRRVNDNELFRDVDPIRVDRTACPFRPCRRKCGDHIIRSGSPAPQPRAFCTNSRRMVQRRTSFARGAIITTSGSTIGRDHRAVVSMSLCRLPKNNFVAVPYSGRSTEASEPISAIMALAVSVESLVCLTGAVRLLGTEVLRRLQLP